MRTLFFFSLLSFLIPCMAETVVVNFQMVYQEHEELLRLDAEFKAEVQTYKQNEQGALAAIQEKQQAFNQLRQKAAQEEMSETERTALTDQATTLLVDLKQAERELQENRQNFERELEAKGVRLRRQVVEDVQQKLKSYAEQQGWELVIDSSATAPNGLPVVQYVKPDLDKTRWLITELNKDFMRANEEKN